MSVAKFKCIECDNLILPQTAAANAGLCGQCAKTPDWVRRAQRDYEAKLSSGEWFTPSPVERASASRPVELGVPTAAWSPQPEYYADSEAWSGAAVVELAASQPAGHAFLVSDLDGRLSLAFNEAYGVCEYQNEETGAYLYAFTPKNLAEQVAADRHLIQACSCCGVEMLWYPSRFHMPRKTAFAIFSGLALGISDADAPPATWLDCGDISYTARGHG